MIFKARSTCGLVAEDPSVYVLLYMLDCCRWDVIDCMRHEEDKIAGNTRDRGEKQGRARVGADPFIPRRLIGKSDAANKLKKGVKL